MFFLYQIQNNGYIIFVIMKIYNKIYIKLCTISFFLYSFIIKTITNTMKHKNHILFHKIKRRKKTLFFKFNFIWYIFYLHKCIS